MAVWQSGGSLAKSLLRFFYCPLMKATAKYQIRVFFAKKQKVNEPKFGAGLRYFCDNWRSSDLLTVF